MSPQLIPGRTYEASCQGKDKLTAEIAKKIVKRSKNRSAEAYHCAHCKGWHVGQGNRMAAKVKQRRQENAE